MAPANPGRNGDPPSKTNALDQYVGLRLQIRRSTSGLLREDLARVLDRDVETIADMEAGRTRISVAELFEICRALQVSIAWFFEGLVEENERRAKAPPLGAIDELMDRGNLENALLSCFDAMPLEGQRQLVTLAQILLREHSGMSSDESSPPSG